MRTILITACAPRHCDILMRRNSRSNPRMSGNSLPITIKKVRGAAEQSRGDRVAIEEPLEIRLGYETPEGRSESSVSITMRTPGNDAELATGFLFTEAIIRGAGDIALVKPCGPAAPCGTSTTGPSPHS